jgi:hypothetical protein
MPTEGLISHRTPHRLRIRIPCRKGDAAYFDSLEQICRTIPQVSSAHANPLTGSLLLTMGPQSDWSLPEVAHKLDLRLQTDVRTTLEHRAANQIGDMNRKVRNFTGGEIDLNSIAFLCCLGLGFFQISVGNLAAPAWYVAFWYAMNLASSKDSAPGKLPAPGESGSKGDYHGGA